MAAWTDERVETLKKLWVEGLSASLIAGRLGGISRNAVIGKAYRMKLEPKRQLITLPRQRGRKLGAKNKNNPEVRQKRRDGLRRILGYAPRIPSDPEPLPPPAQTDIPRIPFAQLDDKPIPVAAADGTIRTVTKHCKWIIGDDPRRMCCGDERIPGLSYCLEHSRRAFSPPNTKVRVPLTRGLNVIESVEELQTA